MSALTTGTVKWFNDERGFGFIEDHNGSRIFVHYSDIATEHYKTLVEGQAVAFELAPTPKGPKAVNVRAL